MIYRSLSFYELAIDQPTSKVYGHNDGPDKLSMKFYLVEPREYSTDFLLNFTEYSSNYYENHLNEESAEVWLHRGFSKMSKSRTLDLAKVDIILIAGYFHLNLAISKPKGRKQTLDLSPMIDEYRKSLSSIYTKDPNIRSRPHLILVPSWNPSVAREVGLKALVDMLQNDLNLPSLWSVGFERNQYWQKISPDRIIPIPYVVRPQLSVYQDFWSERRQNFVFYAGDQRRNAKGWAGCHRDRLVLPLQNETEMDIRLVNKRNRLSQDEYNYRMRTSDYCLILCGDTPSSRSLASAIVSGCIPIRVGSRLRGLCEPPCHRGFGWQPTGIENPHLPYSEVIPWELFPEVDEQLFIDNGRKELSVLFDQFDDKKKAQLRSIMNKTLTGWIYGWGNPVNSSEFGNASEFIWQSFLFLLKKKSLL